MKKEAVTSCAVFLVVCALIAQMFVVSCASAAKRPPAVLVANPERMFWRLDGFDTTGNPSSVYVQGTIGFYDNRLEPFSDAVIQALVNSDIVVSEIGSSDWAKLDKAVENKMLQGAPLDARAQDVRTQLTEAETTALVRILGKNTVESLAVYEPWVLTALLLDAFYAQTAYKTMPAQESVLMETAQKTQGIFFGLDTLKTQLDLLSGGNYADQIVLLKDLIADTAQSSERIAGMDKLYAAYLAGDASAFASQFNSQIREQNENAVYAAHNARLHEKRNENWALLFDGYLQNGGTTFVFADASHFASDNSVFDYMIKKGRLITP